MKKYLVIYKAEIISNLSYITDILASFIGYFLIIYIFLNLWQYIYSDPSEIINGYSMNQMLWYLIITEIIWSIVGGSKLCKRISADVKGGNIAYNINKPYGYIEYILSSHLGLCTIRIVIFFVLGILTGLLFMGSFPDLGIVGLLFVLLSIILAVIISNLFIISIGLIAFFIEDANPLYWVYSKFILVLGTIFPIEFFPIWARGIMTYSPIYAICYGPARLFTSFTYDQLCKVILAQIVYVLVAYTLCKLIYKKGVKSINVNGG